MSTGAYVHSNYVSRKCGNNIWIINFESNMFSAISKLDLVAIVNH